MSLRLKKLQKMVLMYQFCSFLLCILINCVLMKGWKDCMHQVFNPFLPLYEYIPDGEPHVFGNRVYHYGSHDREGGYTFCMEDYVVYSAPVDNLKDWRYEGITYKASQDPDYPKKKYMYAPDVVQGNDGRYYLYYCMGGDYGEGGYSGPISVAVCDTPAGKYEYLGHVQYRDGTPMMKYICFDPAVINDNGTIRIYYGTQYNFEECEDFESNPFYIQEEVKMFGRSREEILAYRKCPESCKDGEITACDSIMGAVMVVVEDDMLTVKEEPKHIIPYKVKGTSFESHPFFEGSSMRKVGDKYYFIYSSWQNHELCYAISDYPDHGFSFGGTIVSNGDVGLNGRLLRDKLNMTGTTHGSIVNINGKWYVFYHRLTHKSDYSRQACAEPIFIEEDGSISQVEITSCGLNGGPLLAKSGYEYPAVICCNLTNGRMPHGSNSIYQIEFPNVTNIGDERFIGEIENNTLIGYKYFEFKDVSEIWVEARAETEKNKVVYGGPLRLDERCKENPIMEGDSEPEPIENISYIEIRLDISGDEIGRILLDDREDWTYYSGKVNITNGIYPLYFIYHGNNKIQLKSFLYK